MAQSKYIQSLKKEVGGRNLSTDQIGAEFWDHHLDSARDFYRDSRSLPGQDGGLTHTVPIAGDST